MWLASNTDAPASYRVAAVLILAYALAFESEKEFSDVVKVLSTRGDAFKMPFGDLVEWLAQVIVGALGVKRSILVLPSVIV